MPLAESWPFSTLWSIMIYYYFSSYLLLKYYLCPGEGIFSRDVKSWKQWQGSQIKAQTYSAVLQTHWRGNLVVEREQEQQQLHVMPFLPCNICAMCSKKTHHTVNIKFWKKPQLFITLKWGKRTRGSESRGLSWSDYISLFIIQTDEAPQTNGTSSR